MAGPAQYENPEPVPPASQLCALPFAAGVAGYLTDALGLANSRVTLHRIMTRDEDAYLQQICSYAGSDFEHSRAGRLFAVTEGIIGKAFSERAIVRTRHFDAENEWWSAYKADRVEVNDTTEAFRQVVSYLAVPFLAPAEDAVVCVLYAEAGGFNVFSQSDKLRVVIGMCEGYCRMLDALIGSPLPRVRNYPLPAGKPVCRTVNAYPRLQETVAEPRPPRFRFLRSFNFAPTT